MDDLASFSVRIPNLNSQAPSALILYFAYYIEVCTGKKEFSAADIKACFEELSLVPYSNISAYLSSNSKNGKALFLKRKTGYVLQKAQKERIAEELSIQKEVPITSALLPLDILDACPYYLLAIAKQMDQCFECNLFDATLVMMRKLLETLIIECFEKFHVDDRIKDKNGNFYFLSDLIPVFTSATEWNVSRNLETYIKNVKKYGDLSAHNRRFIAKKDDLLSFKFELRQVVQEIVLLIDYKQEKK
jgi:hypothetical protein